MIGLMMTTKLPFLFGGDTSLLYASNTYYLYNSVPPVSAASANLATLSANMSSSINNVTGGGGMSSLLNISAHNVQHALNKLIQPPIQTHKMNHFTGVLAAMSSLIFASAVFIFIRKAKGICFILNVV